MANRAKSRTACIGENIRQLRRDASLTQKDLAEKLYKSESAVRMWELGKSEPDSDTLINMATIFGVPVDVILGQPHSKFKSYESSTLPSNIFPITRKRFRMLGEIACGEPIFADEDHETYIEAADNIQADFCLRAKGDSMIGARIQDGDIVFIHEQSVVDNGEIAAVIIGDEATLKRWYYYPDKAKLVLNAENPAYEPLVYVGDELDTIRCLGRAVAFISNL